MRFPLPICLLLASILHADDVSPGVPLPGFRSGDSELRPGSAQVEIRAGDQVDIRLWFEGPPRRATSLWVTPARFAARGEGEPYPDRHFPELKSPAMTGDAIRAFVGKADVTSQLRRAGLDPLVVGEAGTPVVRVDDALRAKQLVDSGALRFVGSEYLAGWELEREIRFRTSNPKDPFRISYKARPGFEVLNARQTAERAADWEATYCLARSELQRWIREQSSYQVTAYEIPVSVNGIGAKRVMLSADLSGLAVVPSLAFCGANGTSTLSRNGVVSNVGARPSVGGSVRILSIAEVR